MEEYQRRHVRFLAWIGIYLLVDQLLVDKIINEQLNVRELEAIIYGEEKVTDKSVSNSNINLFTDETEKELMKKLGNKVKIQANKKYQGKLSLHFDNLDELEHLIELLKK